MKSATLSDRINFLHFRFFLEDGDPGFDVGRFEIGDQSPFEAGAETLFQVRNFFGRTVAGNDDLFLAVIEMIERVKKFFFGSLSSGQIVDIIHQEYIDTSVFLSKIQNFSVLKMIDEIIHEFFCCDIEDFEADGLSRMNMMSDGVHQMGFSQAGSSVDVEGIVRFGRIIYDSRSRSMGKLVAGPDDKVFKGVIGIQVGIEKRPVFGVPFLRRTAHERLGGVFIYVFDLEDFSEKLLREQLLIRLE